MLNRGVCMSLSLEQARQTAREQARRKCSDGGARPLAAESAGRLVVGDRWPAEAEFILSALEAGHAHTGRAAADRRDHPRTPWRTVAALQLYSDALEAAPWI